MSRFSRKPKVKCRVHKRPQLDHNPKPVTSTPPLTISVTYFYITLHLCLGLPSRFPPRLSCISVLPHKGKGKVVPVLTEHHYLKTYWGVELWLHALLTSTLDGGEWSASHPGLFFPRERAPGAHWVGGWMGSRAEKFPAPIWTGTTPIIQPIAQRCTTEQS
jgi:hypothetical protein